MALAEASLWWPDGDQLTGFQCLCQTIVVWIRQRRRTIIERFRGIEAPGLQSAKIPKHRGAEASKPRHVILHPPRATHVEWQLTLFQSWHIPEMRCRKKFFLLVLKRLWVKKTWLFAIVTGWSKGEVSQEKKVFFHSVNRAYQNTVCIVAVVFFKESKEMDFLWKVM